MPIFLSMKRTFLAKRNALLSSANVSWGGIALALAILAVLMRLLVPNFFLRALAPAFMVSNTIAAASHTFLNSFSDTAALAAQNEKLASENDALTNENQALVQKESNLSALLGAASTKTPVPSILAGVAARPPESPYDTLILSVGTAGGAALDQEAFGEGGVPLGFITAISAGFSRVTLFSAPNTITHGWVGRANIPIIISGAGGGAMKVSLSRSANAVVGDIVFALGPGMLPIGSVVRIDSDPSSPGVELRIVPAANPFSLSWVLLRDTGASRDSFMLATSTNL